VEHIGLKTTRIRGTNGEQIVIGNNDLLKARINNFQRMVERRAVFVLRVSYETTAEQLQRIPVIVHDAVMRQKLTRYERCHFFRYGESSLDFEIVFWMLTADYTAYMNAQQAINLEIFTTFGTEGIRFASPTRTVYLHGETTASRGTATS
jgi:small-conductance mechanosensitive channel